MNENVSQGAWEGLYASQSAAANQVQTYTGGGGSFTGTTSTANCSPYPWGGNQFGYYYYPQYYHAPIASQYTLALAILSAKGVSAALKRKAEAILAKGLA